MTSKKRRYKSLIITATAAITLAIHYYGWIFEPYFGHSHFLHVIHSRLCYIPILIAASWFGLRGGVITALLISLLVMPYVFWTGLDTQAFMQEFVEIFFYFGFGVIIGWLIDRELIFRKKNEEAQIQIERAHRLSLMGRIASGVAHEIKNPLASIKGAVEILEDENASPKDREEFKNIIFNEIRRVDSTVSEFLNFARPREAHPEPVDFGSVVGDSLKQLEAQASKSRIALKNKMKNGLIINADREQIHQVIINLVLNALDASDLNSIIEIHLEKTGDQKAVLKVRDYGTGIDPFNLEMVFEPFFTTRASGTGLGLAIVKSIIENHRGDVIINSKPGKGTEIKITLPLYVTND
jgi:signal transduction histidine kinase